MLYREPQKTLLEVDNLSVAFHGETGWKDVVKSVSFSVRRGETLCIVGESGSGKSVSAFSVLGLLPPKIARQTGGTVNLEGRRLDALDEISLNAIRGREIGMIFQEPMTSLNPVLTVGYQVMEAIRTHEASASKAARERALEMLDLVRIPDARKRLDAYPHELSGGMRQRVMIAMALACRPKLLIADEPTTALDVTIQAQILALIDDLKRELDTGVILITHDMGVVAEMADTVAVFRQGEKVEEGSVGELLATPRHTYTRALLAATPRIGGGSWRDGRGLAAERSSAPAPALPLAIRSELTLRSDRLHGRPGGATMALSARGLAKHFQSRRGLFGGEAKPVRAVDGVWLDLPKGETVAVVGESGCGKSTLARLLMLTLKPTDGQIELDGQPLHLMRRKELHRARRRIQMVFQDPYASLHPQMTARQIVAEPLVNLSDFSRAEIDRRVGRLFERCGLSQAMLDRYPFEFSGGQRQRIAIARAIVLEPAVVVADEPVSALDVSVQAQILDLLTELQHELGLSYLFISHDLSVVEYVSDIVAVMYLGRIVELARREDLYRRPLHPYTRMLFDSAPSLDPANRRFTKLKRPQADELPSPSNIPSGCRFRTRCRFATEQCAAIDPPLTERGGGHQVACHYPGVADAANRSAEQAEAVLS
ncbi:ABC transporter ATP-binding protein [Consotaella aegiceratis]|uniref:ABC transporter ATP-binding protein n=1 Tax=Consotaella aegiceratis TaxID=3097961 RepID=UPI002F41E62F